MTNSIKAILIDDEEHAIILFKKVLELFPNAIEVVGEASNLPDGLKLINQLKPNVVFLDINMPKYSGLEMNDFMESHEREFEIIFVTAHNEYAIEAFKTAAFDYILKPVDEESLKNTLKRLETYFDKSQLENPKKTSNNPQKISINTHQGTHYLDVEQIYYVEAAAMYCIIHTEKEELTVSKPLAEIEQLVNPYFFRVHRSYLVNTKKIKMLNSKDGSDLELLNGKKVVLARNKIDDFKKFMVMNYGL